MKKSFGPQILIGPAPVWCVGTYDTQGRPNVMTASWAGICCSRPPSLAVSLRKATHTHGNIVKTKAFTVSVPSRTHLKEADFFGLASGRAGDKFEAAGLTPVKASTVNAPYVGEFPLVAECRLLHTFELGLHTQFVGEIVEVKAEEGILAEDGFPSMEKLDPFFFAPGSDLYFALGDLAGRAFDAGEELKKSYGGAD